MIGLKNAKGGRIMANSIEIDLIGQKCYNFFTKGWGKQHLIGGEKMKDAVKIKHLVLRGKIYFIDFYDKMGRRIRFSLKTDNLELAEQRVALTITEAYQKGYFNMEKPVKITFSDLVPEVLKHAKKNTARLEKIYLPAMKGLTAFFGKKYLYEITPRLVKKYQEYQSDKVSAGSSNTGIGVLRKSFNIAKENGYIKENPVDRIEKLKVPKRPKRTLTVEELNILLSFCDKQLKLIIILALLSGMRKGEIRTLTWANVDFINKNFIINKTKNNETRIIGICDEFLEVLLELHKNKVSDYVFANKDGSPYYDFRMFEKAVKLSGIAKIRFHDLRHSFATVGSRVTEPFTLQAILGHKKIETTLIYVNQNEVAKRDAIIKIKNYFFGEQANFKDTI